MNSNFWELLFYSAIFGFVGYIAGETIGYARGINSAANVWEKSLEMITKAFIESLPKVPKNNEINNAKK